MVRRFIALACALVLLAPPALAQASGVEPALFSGMHWRMIGPTRGGRVVAVSGVSGDPNRFYFGAVGGGVWRTENAGRTWNPIFDDQPVASIGAIALAPSDPNTIYVGSGEADMRSDILQGNGMYRSTDAGKTWTRIGLADSRAIGRIAVDPHDSKTLLVAALGHPYGPSHERGIFRSTDGGATWTNTLFVDDNTGAIDVTLDPNGVAYATMWQTRRPPWSVYPPSNGPGSGLYKSTDGGLRWTALRGNGFATKNLGRIGVAVAPSDSKRVYAVVDATDGGLYRSDDAGASWKKIDDEARIWGRGWYFSEVAVDPRERDVVYVSNTSLYRSNNGGSSFTAIKGAPGGDDYHMLWIDPTQSARMILASDQGAIVTTDGAQTWSSWYNQPTAQLYHVATDSRFPFTVYGAQQDSGAVAVPSRSGRLGISALDWRPQQAGGESDSIAVDPRDPDLVYGGRVQRQNMRTREVRDLTPTLVHPGSWRDEWTLPLVFSPVDPRVLYYANQQLFRTADGGSSWQIISPDLTRLDPGVPANLDAATAVDVPSPEKRRGIIYTIAPSPIQRGTIWIGTDDGVAALTRDEGKHWNIVTPSGLAPWSKFGIIEASHVNANEAYAAVDRHRVDDVHPYIYRTRDGGKSWTSIVAGIPDGSFVNAVREDPLKAGLLYAGTENGVFVSFDDGDAWQPLQLNLPNTSIRDLTVRDDALAIATHGRSFWILDDLTPLRQSSAALARESAHLFAPQVATRVQPKDDEGTPLPPDVSAGENPPDGAILDYYLGKAAHTVALDIIDRTGASIRRFASDDKIDPIDPSKLDIPAFYVKPQAVPETAPGMHRFGWDLHYQSLGAGRRRRRGSGGPWAVPGAYRVRLTVDGKPSEQPFLVRLDPRDRVAPRDLQAQFAMSLAIEHLKGRIAEARSAKPDPKDARDLRLLGAFQALDELEASVESAPGAPSADQRAAFAVRRDAAEAALRANAKP